jgi:transcriptional regulator with XRE-family HTH domain
MIGSDSLPRKKDKNELFAKRLTQLRKEKGLPQKEVAAELGLTIGTLSAYENGREPRYEYLKRIAQFFDVSVDYLVGEDSLIEIGKIRELKNSAEKLLKELNVFLEVLK